MTSSRNLFFRIASTFVFFTFLFLGLFQGRYFFWVLPVVLAGAALEGVIEALRFGGGHLPRVYTALALAAALAMLGDAYWLGFDHILVIIGVLTVVAMGAGVVQKEGNQMAMAGQCVTATIYVAFPLALLTYIVREAIHNKVDSPQHYLIFLLLATWSSDIGAFFVGRKFGRHKLAPTLSPGKTVEGFLGGIASTLIVVVCLHVWWDNINRIFSLTEVIALGFIFSVIGPIGDLAESRLKRSAGIKDSGETFTGHGGMLDIIDSLLFTTPVYYGYLLVMHPNLF